MNEILKHGATYLDHKDRRLTMSMTKPGSPFPFEDQHGIRYTVTGRLPGHAESYTLTPATEIPEEETNGRVIIMLEHGMPMPDDSLKLQINVFCNETIRDAETGAYHEGQTMSLYGKVGALRKYIAGIDTGRGVWTTLNPMLGNWSRETAKTTTTKA